MTNSFVLALKDAKSSDAAHVVGYYRGDDESLTNDKALALKYQDRGVAASDADLANCQWYLDSGQKFEVVDI